MDTNYCNGCGIEFEDDQETFELEEDSDIYYCFECIEDLKDQCPFCNAGCNYCLMLEW